MVLHSKHVATAHEVESCANTTSGTHVSTEKCVKTAIYQENTSRNDISTPAVCPIQSLTSCQGPRIASAKINANILTAA
jgi:hypothetical protein